MMHGQTKITFFYISP